MAADVSAQVGVAVDAAGNVSSSNPTAIAAAGNTLSFQTTDVTIDPTADFTGDWYALGVLSGPQYGMHTFKIVPTIPHWLRAGAYAGDDVEIRMDEAGMASAGNPQAVTAI